MQQSEKNFNRCGLEVDQKKFQLVIKFVQLGHITCTSVLLMKSCDAFKFNRKFIFIFFWHKLIDIILMFYSIL